MLGASSMAEALAGSHPATLIHIFAAAGGTAAALAEQAGSWYGPREHVDFLAQLLTGVIGVHLATVSPNGCWHDLHHAVQVHMALAGSRCCTMPLKVLLLS
jgi:hypothetical protein